MSEVRNGGSTPPDRPSSRETERSAIPLPDWLQNSGVTPEDMMRAADEQVNNYDEPDEVEPIRLGPRRDRRPQNQQQQRQQRQEQNRRGGDPNPGGEDPARPLGPPVPVRRRGPEHGVAPQAEQRAMYEGEWPDAGRYNGTMEAAVQVKQREVMVQNERTGEYEVRNEAYSVIHYDVPVVRSLEEQAVLQARLDQKMENPRFKNAVTNLLVYVENRKLNPDATQEELVNVLDDFDWWVMAARHFLINQQDNNETAEVSNRKGQWDWTLSVRVVTRDPVTRNWSSQDTHKFFDLMPDFWIEREDGTRVSRKELLRQEMAGMFRQQNRRGEHEQMQQSGKVSDLERNPNVGYFLTRENEDALGNMMGMDGENARVGDLMTHAENLYAALAHCRTKELTIIGPSGKEYKIWNYFGYAIDEKKEPTRQEIQAFLREELGATDMEASHAFYAAESYAKIQGLVDWAGAKNQGRPYQLRREDLPQKGRSSVSTARDPYRALREYPGMDVSNGYRTGTSVIEGMMHLTDLIRTNLNKGEPIPGDREGVTGKNNKLTAAGYKHFWTRQETAMPASLVLPARMMYAFNVNVLQPGRIQDPNDSGVRSMDYLLMPQSLGGAGWTRKDLFGEKMQAAISGAKKTLDGDYEEFMGRAAKISQFYVPRSKDHLSENTPEPIQAAFYDNMRHEPYAAFCLAVLHAMEENGQMANPGLLDMNLMERTNALLAQPAGGRGDTLEDAGVALMRFWMREWIEACWQNVDGTESTYQPWIQMIDAFYTDAGVINEQEWENLVKHRVPKGVIEAMERRFLH